MLGDLAKGVAYYSAVVAASSTLYSYFLARVRGVLKEGFSSVFLRFVITLAVYTSIYLFLSLLLRHSDFLHGCVPDVILYTAAILVLVLITGVVLGSKTMCGALSVLGSGVMKRY